MKHGLVFLTTVGILTLTAGSAPAETTDQDKVASQVKNVQNGARNASTGWVEIFDGIEAAESKSQNTAEKFTGFIAGAGIGTQKALHKTAAGVLELCTFWIPKEEPLLNSTKDPKST